jgi:hypothetical protein
VGVVEGFGRHGEGLGISLVENRGKGVYARDEVLRDGTGNLMEFEDLLNREIRVRIKEHDCTR